MRVLHTNANSSLSLAPICTYTRERAMINWANTTQWQSLCMLSCAINHDAAPRSLWELHIPLSHKYIYSLQIPHRAATSNTHPPLLRWKMSECIVVWADLHRADNIPQQMHWRERSLVIDSNVQYAGLTSRCSRVPDDGLCAERGENSNLRLC